MERFALGFCIKMCHQAQRAKICFGERTILRCVENRWQVGFVLKFCWTACLCEARWWVTVKLPKFDQTMWFWMWSTWTFSDVLWLILDQKNNVCVDMISVTICVRIFGDNPLLSRCCLFFLHLWQKENDSLNTSWKCVASINVYNLLFHSDMFVCYLPSK